MSADEMGWVRAASRADLREGEVLGVDIGGRSVALYEDRKSVV